MIQINGIDKIKDLVIARMTGSDLTYYVSYDRERDDYNGLRYYIFTVETIDSRTGKRIHCADLKMVRNFVDRITFENVGEIRYAAMECHPIPNVYVHLRKSGWSVNIDSLSDFKVGLRERFFSIALNPSYIPSQQTI